VRRRVRGREARPVALQRVARAGDDARIAREAEVIVRAEHDPLGALHLHHGAGGAFEAAEIGKEIRLARGAQLL